jgi:hypothetical protein
MIRLQGRLSRLDGRGECKVVDEASITRHMDDENMRAI